MSLISYEEYLEQEKRLYLKCDFSDENDIIIDRDISMFPDWNDLTGTDVFPGAVPAGTVCVYEGIKYLIIQDVFPIVSQPPSMDGMLAIYKPYRDSGIYEWLSGEYVEIGWVRTYEGVSYKAVQDPNANIYAPIIADAIWEPLEEDSNEQ